MRKISFLFMVMLIITMSNGQEFNRKSPDLMPALEQQAGSISSNVRSYIYFQDFEGDFPGDMTILDLDKLTPDGSPTGPGKWSKVPRKWDLSTNCASVTSYYADGNKTANDWLITPGITIPSEGNINLLWESSSEHSLYLDSYKVLISLSKPDTNNWDASKFTLLQDYKNDPAGFKYRAINLNAYKGKEVWIAFYNYTTDGWNIYVDNITVADLKANDIAVSAPLFQYTMAEKQQQELAVRVINMGTDAITTFKANWKIKGTETTHTTTVSGINLNVGSTLNVILKDLYSPRGTSLKDTLEIWLSDTNNKTDENNDNNQVEIIVSVVKGYFFQDFNGRVSLLKTFDVDKIKPDANTPASTWYISTTQQCAVSQCIDSSKHEGKTTDDWLILPKIKLDSGAVVEWKHKSPYEKISKLAIYVSESFDGENLDTAKFEFVDTVSFAKKEYIGWATKLDKYRDKEVNIAFRNISAKGLYVYLDDIHVHVPASSIDLGISNITNLRTAYLLNDTVRIKGEVMNEKLTPITSYELKYSYGLDTVTQNFEVDTLFYLRQQTFEFSQLLKATVKGVQPLRIWVSKVNKKEDVYTENNEKLIDLEAVANPQKKAVVLEKFTGAWCGGCPNGAHELKVLREKYQDSLIAFDHHTNDKMATNITIPITTAYSIQSFPSGIINRALNPEKGLYSLNAKDWDAKVAQHLQEPTSIGIEVSGELNKQTKNLTANVSVNFTNTLNGKYTVTLYVIEDSLSGTGYGWDQTNYFNEDPTSPYYGLGNPIIGYVHRYVLRSVVSNANGDDDIVPVSNASGEYKKSYTLPLPDTYKEKDVMLVAFISKYTAESPSKGIIVNGAISHLTIINSLSNLVEQEVMVSPNPANQFFTVSGIEQAKVEIFGFNGNLVMGYDNINENSPISTSLLENGIYIIKVTENSTVKTGKIIVNK